MTYVLLYSENQRINLLKILKMFIIKLCNNLLHNMTAEEHMVVIGRQLQCKREVLIQRIQ